MVEIRARCHPALAGILPRPVPAAEALPDWLRSMPSEIAADSLGGASVRTLKHCPPFLDALGLGILMPLAADVTVAGGALHWDWSPPVLPDARLPRAPVGLHVPEQAAGAPLALGGRVAVKFLNFWTLSVPEGWSILFTHPAGRDDLPFRTLTGVVDCDSFGAGYVHFPAVWIDPAFEGRLAAGTPVAQAIALPRGPAVLSVGAQDAAELAAATALLDRLAGTRGVYRKGFRGRRG